MWQLLHVEGKATFILRKLYPGKLSKLTTDVPAPVFSRNTVAMLLNMEHKRMFYEEVFQLTTSSQCCETIKKENTFMYFKLG